MRLRTLAVIDALAWPGLLVWANLYLSGVLYGPVILIAGLWALRKLACALEREPRQPVWMGVTLFGVVRLFPCERGPYRFTTCFVARVIFILVVAGIVVGLGVWLTS